MGFDENQAPAGGTSQDQADNGLNYERSYNELRPEYTRATQELSAATERLSEYEQLFEALSDPSTQNEALSMLGFEVDTGTQEEYDEFVDPLEQELESLRAQVQDLSESRELEASAAEEAELIAMRDDFIGETISFIEQQTNTEFTAREEEVLGNLAISMAGDDGIPDIQSAYSALYGSDGVLEANRSRWIQSKTGAFSAPLGTSIPADRRPQTGRDRVAYIDQRLSALDQE